jgi:L-asparaginase
VTRVTDGFTLKDASDKSFAELKTFDGFAGVIGISSKGEVYHTDSHPYMVWAAFDGSLQVFN